MSDYAAWLGTNPSLVHDALCSWNGSYQPSANNQQCGDVPFDGSSSLPVVCIDWCDARDYCAGIGKRLCGAIGGGSIDYNDPSDYKDATKDEWFAACSANGTRTYPYGNTFDDMKCVDVASTGCTMPATACGVPKNVGSATNCKGGVGALHDMSGNVWEWEDSCAASTGAGDTCSARGGSFWEADGASGSLACAGRYGSYTRNTQNKNIGFRCCADPK